jgi:hypothetical protein
MPKKKPPELDFERVQQADLAAILRVDARTLRRWAEMGGGEQGLPRNADGTYHLQAVLWWMRASGIRPAAAR